MGKRDDICSFLGYEKDNPTKDRRNLLKSTSAFLADYEARGNKVYGRKAESIGSRLCAVNFLEEEGRGERFWPPTSDGSLVYEQARDKKIIIDHVADLFLIHARSNYSKLETYLEDEEPQFTYSSSLMTIKPELCLTPWLDPPKRFDRNVAMPWAERIDPKNLPDPPVRLGKDWLSQKSVQWPSAVDKEIQYFMHRWLFYYTPDLENGADDGIQSLVSLLRKKEGPSAELDGTQLREFRKRIIDRVKHWTETFINHQFIELQGDGVPQMSARFRAIWTTLKYDTPTPRVSNRRRSVEEELPPETHRKRRKLSKKSEDNALDSSRSKRKPWTENAWRRKTIPPPADMTFPNLISRKSSNIDPVTVMVTAGENVNEESNEERFQKFEVHEVPEHTIQNSKISVEIPLPCKSISNKADVFIKMEEESTIEVSQLGTTVTELSDDNRFSEAKRVAVPTKGVVIKSPSPNPDDTVTLETTPPHVQDNIQGPEAKSILSHQSSNTSEGRNLSPQSELLDTIVMPNQSSETIADGPLIDKVVGAQAEVIDSQLSTRIEHPSQLLQTADVRSSPKVKEDLELRIEVSTQPIELDGEDFTKGPTPKQLEDQVDEPRRAVPTIHQIIMENDDRNTSDSITPPETLSSENSKKCGPFNDTKILNQLFSSNASRAIDTQRTRGTSSISPTSSADMHTHEMDKNLFPRTTTQNSVLPRASPSIELAPKESPPEKLSHQGDIITVNNAFTEGLSNSSQIPKTAKPQSGHSNQIPSLDVLETSQKSFERNDSNLTRTPLPSGPLTSETGQETSTLLPIVRQSTTTISDYPKSDVSSPVLPQNPVQEPQAAFRDPLVSGFQPINRPMSSLALQSSPAPISQSSAGVYKSSIAPQQVRDQRQSKQMNETPKQSEAIFPQIITREPGRSSEPSWTRNVHLNSYPVNSQNGVYPMAFVSKPTASKNDVWMQETSRKRQLEQTNTKPRKTKSRKKSTPCEKPTMESGTAQYPLASSAPASQNTTPSVIQIQSPRQPEYDQKRSPKPPHPELINHLRIMDEKMGTNSGASYQYHLKTTNSPSIISNQQSNNHGRNMDQSRTNNYDSRQENSISNQIVSQEQVHLNRKRSSEDWSNAKSSVGMHHSTSVGSPAQSQRTSSMSQKRTSIPEAIQISRMEQERFQHGMQQNRRLPNAGENKFDSQNGKQQISNLPKLDIQIKINPAAFTTQNQVPSKENAQNRADIEIRNQWPDSAHMGQSESVRLREAEARHGASINSGTGRIISKSPSMSSPKTSQHLKDLQGTQDRVYNHAQQSNPAQTNQHPSQQSQGPKTHSQTQVNSSSPELYRSQDPWWNSLATDYNISTIPKQPSRYVPQTSTNVLHNRTIANTTPVSIVPSASQVQVGSQESLPDMRQAAPQATERPHSTGSQASKVFHQTPESQRAKYSSTTPANTQNSPPQNYSVDEDAAQPSQTQNFNPSGQSAQSQFGVRPSTSQNEFSKQAPSKSSNESTPSPSNQSHQPVTQPSNYPLTSSKSQYNNNATSQHSHTQASSFHRQATNQHHVQPAIIQSPVTQNQFANRPTAHFSPVQPSFPQNRYTDPSPVQQASTAPGSYTPEHNGQQRATSQYQYPKRPQQPQQPAEPQITSTHAQQNFYNEQNPHDRTKSTFNGASPQTIMHSVSASPMQSPINQIPASQPSLATTMSAILNPRLPPTPPTPAIVLATGSDPMSKFPLINQSMSGNTPRQQASAIITTPKINNNSHHYHPATYPPRQQATVMNSAPKLDTTSKYSPSAQSLATPQQTPTTPQGARPKLDFYLQRSSSLIDTSISFSYQYMESLSLPNLFAFFSQRSGIPSERLDDLTFRCMFGEYQQFVIGKNMGDGEWKRARKRIWRNWDRDVKSAKQNGDDADEEFWEVNILIGRCA